MAAGVMDFCRCQHLKQRLNKAPAWIAIQGPYHAGSRHALKRGSQAPVFKDAGALSAHSLHITSKRLLLCDYHCCKLPIRTWDEALASEVAGTVWS